MSIKICIKYKLQIYNKSLNFYKIYILIEKITLRFTSDYLFWKLFKRYENEYCLNCTCYKSFVCFSMFLNVFLLASFMR